MNTHSLVRTNEKGKIFIGKCVYCGEENLTIEQGRRVCVVEYDEDKNLVDAITKEGPYKL